MSTVQVILISADVWVVLTVAGVGAFAIAWKLAKRSARNERESTP